MTLQIHNSTVSLNDIINSSSGSVYGGGISSVNCDLQLSFVTITKNSIRYNPTHGNAYGGGVYVNSLGSVEIINSLLADNQAQYQSRDCYSTSSFLSLGNNFIEDTTDCGIVLTGGDLTGTVSTDALADNGGPNQTVATDDVVATIGTGSCLEVDGTTVVDTDQRGAPRPSSDCAKGAYEPNTFYTDTDGDGYGDDATATTKYATGLVIKGGDCDETKTAINPGAIEICDSIDNDCDGTIDDGFTTKWYQDLDKDGYGNNSVSKNACTQPTGYVADNTDCKDANTIAAKAVHPGATEKCDGIDNNCDGTVDEITAVDITVWYLDADADGYGNLVDVDHGGLSQKACTKPSGYVSNKTDCNDVNRGMHHKWVIAMIQTIISTLEKVKFVVMPTMKIVMV